MRLFLFLLVILVSCGDNSPFDEDYWDNDSTRPRQTETQDTKRYEVLLRPLSSVNFGQGLITVDLNIDSAFLRLEIQALPQNYVLAQIVTISAACETIVTTPPLGNTFETKSITYSESGSRQALFPERNGFNIENQSMLVYAFSLGEAGLPPSVSFPLACGAITTAAPTTEPRPLPPLPPSTPEPPVTSTTGGAGTLGGGTLGGGPGGVTTATNGTTFGTTGGGPGGVTTATNGTTFGTTGGGPGGITTATNGTTFGYME
jgi:hypothetical protein